MLTCGPELAAGHCPQGSADDSGHRYTVAAPTSAEGAVPGSTAESQWLEAEEDLGAVETASPYTRYPA